MNIQDLVYGNSRTTNIVACDYRNDRLHIWIERDGLIESREYDIPYFLISDRDMSGSVELAGSLPLKYLSTFDTKRRYWDERNRGGQFLGIYDDREMAMILGGFTLFKGMKPSDVSILSFDIETTGLVHDETSKVVLISNTFRKNGTIIRQLFAYDDYENEGAMLTAWCDWVRSIDPSLICGHNIYKFDFPYLDYCARQNGVTLNLGRDGSRIEIDTSYQSKFRYDQGTSYPFYDVQIFGRNIVDTFFLALRYDFVEKRYASYGLKQIIKQEGLERADREYYDASSIRHNYLVAEEWRKIKLYAEHDADDSLALFDLMIPAQFYLAQSVPKTFQKLLTSASGGQINAMMVRAYVQEGHSLPLPSEEIEYEGAISIGNPGVYENVFKVDVASLYPSIMLEYRVSDQIKDPLSVLTEVLSYLTSERLKNKKLAKETGQQSYKALSDAQKIIINSFYGFLGTRGLNFNSPEKAALVTQYGREILQKAIGFATSNELKLVNADTDSISVEGVNNREKFLADLNDIFPKQIRWEDDGTYERVLVLKIKNYVLDQAGKRTIKGAALKATPKEPALREFIRDLIDALIYREDTKIVDIYSKYVREILEIKDIARWSSKKTISSSILHSDQTTAVKTRAALEGTEYAQGDKRHVYFRPDGSLSLTENFKQDHDTDKLLQKLYKTLCIFKPVYDVSSCPNYSLKKNKILLSRI